MEPKLVVRSRGIIFYNDKLLIVRHNENSDLNALPGGHLEENEDPVDCIEREIFEELGVVPKIGRLFYVNSFTRRGVHSIELLFEITNGEDFLDIEKLKGTHRHELFEIRWIGRDEDVVFLPTKVLEDFKNGTLLSDSVKFIK